MKEIRKDESVCRDVSTLVAFKPATLSGHLPLPAKITNIASQACWLMPNIEGVSIPDGVTEVGEDAFALCSNLKSIYIPSSVERVGGYIAANCHQELTIFCEGEPGEKWDPMWNRSSRHKAKKNPIPVTYNVSREWYEAFVARII